MTVPAAANARVSRDLKVSLSARAGSFDPPTGRSYSGQVAGAENARFGCGIGQTWRTLHRRGSRSSARLSSASSQEGCIVAIADREALPGFSPGRELDIGEFGFKFDSTSARHWIVTYRTKDR
jgi:hypothetical protein